MSRCINRAIGPSELHRYPPRCPNEATIGKRCDLHWKQFAAKLEKAKSN